jgi:hypothetical protein
VNAFFHHADDFHKRFEVIGFSRDEWVFFEERNDHSRQIGELSYRVPAQSLVMIVASDMTSDLTTLEVSLQSMKHIDAPLSKNHDETRLNLPTEFGLVIPKERNTEATFAVDESDDPLRETWPFLLIVRTERIVTLHIATETDGCDALSTVGCSEFPAFGRLHSARSLLRGAIPGHVSGGFTLGTFVTTREFSSG